MISFITYMILTYLSINFILWLYNLNKPEEQIKEYQIIQIQSSLQDDMLIKNFKDSKLTKDIKLNKIYKKDKIYKKHLRVCVKNVEYDVI